MIFNEIFSTYYSTVGRILSSLLEQPMTDREIEKIISGSAFSESVLAIMPALKNGDWQLIDGNNSPVIHHSPSTPLTHIEKQWLKAIALDKRIQLFDINFPELESIQPLFTPDDFYIFDSYKDGDNYEDENYIANFRLIVQAVKEQFPLEIEILNRLGKPVSLTVMPDHLEYSEKDDKFRLITIGGTNATVVNLGRIITCRKSDKVPYTPDKSVSSSRNVTIELIDQRNALERVMLHFAHFEKQAEKIDDNRYRIRIWYDRNDETEMVIRILSFGPFIKVISPQHFVDLIISRLKRQKNIGP